MKIALYMDDEFALSYVAKGTRYILPYGKKVSSPPVEFNVDE